MKRLPSISAAVFAALLAAAGIASAQSGGTPPQASAIFAGGCFWCVEADFDKVNGVISTTSGYIGGRAANPTYNQVVSGTTGHTEAVEIVYDPSKVTFAKLLDVFWRNHDPLAKNRQFCDAGEQYRAGIFYRDDEQKKLAEETRKTVQMKFAPRIVHTEVTQATTFYKAEEYHQDYYKKNPVRYNLYRFNCGRDQRLKDLWGAPDKSS
ncbi:MAG: peptide-methionine (S)-S-oxide reductase MsrA [Alphaproteobacteria bacterium]|nr:peptide-methionine (S)-S-oxide reductase MsrA [Alphaproteobacteria bacterium]